MRHQIAALGLTLALEGGGMLLFSLVAPSQRRRVALNLAVALALNAVTHTLFWNIFPLFMGEGDSYAVTLVAAECLVSLVEATVYRLACGIPAGQALVLSLALNALSWGAGGAVLGAVSIVIPNLSGADQVFA